DFLANHFQAIQESGCHADGRAMLVVVEDGNVHAFPQGALDVEAFRRLDVFEVNAPEGRLQPGNDFYQFLWILLIDFDIEDINAGELLEQYRLALHDGLGRQGANVSEAQHRSTVGDDADQIAPGRIFKCIGGVVDDFFTGSRDARRIGQR